MYKKLSASYHEEIARLYTANAGQPIKFGERGFYPRGAIFTWQLNEKDAPVNCFAVLIDGSIKHGRHEELIGLFAGSADIAIGAKKRYHDKY